ncbi:MAG TPA: NERD domain-containing protein [Bacillales bacterium]|nr:NERD domain-containing protein [Bacillales bacterium]
MLLKARTESDELLAMRYLNPRMELTDKAKFRYSNLEKGYEGEVSFDLLTKNLQEERYILNDLLLEVNNSTFQIDSLIISKGVIHLLDVKNFEGDCYFQSDKFFSVNSGREYANPVTQLNKCTTHFRQLLQNHKMNYLVESSVIFINPEFTLYQAPMNLPIVLPTQVNRFIRNLNNTPSTLNDGHKNLAQKLLSLHQTKNRFAVLPEYEYEQLQKGIFCLKCKSLSVAVNGRKCVCCWKCGHKEDIEAAVLRSVKEFKLLFPDRKLTTNAIYEWCHAVLGKKTICRVLKKNYTTHGNTSDTYYK